MQTLKFDVHGMTCGGCTGRVQRALSKIDGVSHVDVSLRPGTATLEADTARVTPGRKDTSTWLTPSILLSARCTLPVQPPQVMPWTSNLRVCMVSFPCVKGVMSRGRRR